ncbi:hypothetical protein PF001_g12143 [Phytophthora fragariae]|nr:hypothetical protein PF003_g12864 [Phytophthora fragariae]KAE8902950.1 hypothetical protein PF003_g12865 [Phytophthora fragariae]KAE9006110.1 hypothetical protein PF011_g11740 [Phytophthora fragariae]KAE9306381.1 hypothetical protein PF001_g12141 [Phytophthora fragariae]KAE9306382.1 hypothetical protein PF001_g12143 [Phytophthora fragariae]
MPREYLYAAQETTYPVTRPNNVKAMERRRVSGF